MLPIRVTSFDLWKIILLEPIPDFSTVVLQRDIWWLGRSGTRNYLPECRAKVGEGSIYNSHCIQSNDGKPVRSQPQAAGTSAKIVAKLGFDGALV